ncbi:alanine racemase [Variovorax sp. WS11]|uniref:DSD1 family PLP-dependent enzyme n=1 Tax=Variovorax sp. WS11 TaxID=1105204 RepID=UPI000D0DAD56|nr:DSD1 family PLP-dependent enzyme [Variovorax sp. WS11]NDZ13522.1 DSD1 family PLP-dependent enzyme [Variovorax sp. WS11]PSL84374.1 alanine racemase [Variovorax sp. WS11]
MTKQVLEQLETPALLLDPARMDRNIERMRNQARRLGVTLRPHVKTNKSMDVTRRMMETPEGPITVSTLREADYFAAHGVKDILYAVCIAPNKLDHVMRLQDQGVRLTLILDSMEAARVLAQCAHEAQRHFELLIEVDSDGHRSGVNPDSGELLSIAQFLEAAGIPVQGILTHAGSSYDCTSTDAICAMAEQERAAAVHAAQRLRAAGIACPVVSVGSTPTALFAERLEGITEVRAGVFVFFDLFMAGLNVCGVDDIALSVLATVIGHQREKGWTILDAGWMAMSRDRGTARQPVDQGYGLVCDLDGRPLEDLILVGANQEHGIMAHRSGKIEGALQLPVGAQVRILPNHACPTAAQYDHYKVLGPGHEIEATWPRISGW